MDFSVDKVKTPNGAKPKIAQLECMQKDMDSWGTGKCDKKVLKNPKTGKTEVSCQCTLFSTTTMMTGMMDAFANNNIGNVFSAGSLDLLANLEFWTYAIFYIGIFFTITMVLFGVYGNHRDRVDLVSAIEEELKALPRDKDVIDLENELFGRPLINPMDEKE